MKTVAALSAACVAAVLPAVASAQSVGRFYRQSDLPTVWFQYDEAYHCAVQNPGQMEAFGGFPQVVTQPSLRMRGENTGLCPFPDGYYRRSHEERVYRLHGGGRFNVGDQACYVTDPAQMNRLGGFAQIRAVEPSSDLSIARPRPGPCAG